MAKTEVVEPKVAVVEMKKELQRLVKAIVEEENDDDSVTEETYDRVKETVLGLKELKFKKPPQIPQHFHCPLSREVMVDPVIIVSGQTYDRQYIQSWLDAGNQTCPQTQQVLSHMNLIPNTLVRDMILQSCKNPGVELPSLVDEVSMAVGDQNHFDSLLKKVVSKSLSEQRQAAKDLRLLTKKMVPFRAYFTKNPDAIGQLFAPLSNGVANCHPDLQEDLITTVLNLSILDDNKKLVAENPVAIRLLVESLGTGTIQVRANAAAALFTLSAVDSNKAIIGNAGALKPLIDLLEDGNPLTMKDVSAAIFTLCINHENKSRAVSDGAVNVILQKIIDGVLVDELLATLALLSTHQIALEKMSELGAVPLLLNIINGSSCARNKENSVAILYSICYSDRAKLKEVREEEQANGCISQLVQNGTSRAKRKAGGILDRLNRPTYLTRTA